MLRLIATILIASHAVSPSNASNLAPAGAREKPRNVVIMLGNGVGPAGLTLARTVAGGSLELDKIFVGVTRTYSSNSLVPDSAASATAIATGVKSFNGAVGVDPDGKPVASLLDAAEAAGLSTGLVATSRITYVTPASFSAHTTNARLETEIASQQLASGIDLILGGGARYLLPKSAGGARDDERNLFSEARQAGYQVLRSREEFDGALKLPLLGTFSNGHMAFEIDRDGGSQPSLAEMTKRALDLLSQSKKGFVLVVAGCRIEHAAHAHDVAAYLYDCLAYDNAVKTVLDFARADRETLVVCTSDHETGGMSLGRTSASGASAWHPGILQRVKCSIGRMQQEVKAGAGPVEVLAKRTGIGNLSEEAKVQLLDAAESGEDQRFVRIISDIISAQVGIGWTTWGHTGVDVPLHAFGPGSETFRGVHDNTEVGLIVAEKMGFDLPALTQSMRKGAKGKK